MQSIASERLMEMLNWWKYLSIGREIEDLPMLYPGQADLKEYLGRWRMFERMVLDNSIPYLDPKDWFQRRAQLPYEPRESIYNRYRSAQSFPCELFAWNRSSRRAFHIPEALQCVFMAGDYSSWKWDDLVWPYESAVLTLERPFDIEVHEGEWSSFDTILFAHVTHPSAGKVAVIRLFRKPKTVRPQMFPIREMNQINKFLATDDRLRAERILSRLEDRLISYPEATQGDYTAPLYSTIKAGPYPLPASNILVEFSDLQETTNKDIVAFNKESERLAMETLSMAIKTVVGWAAYMGHLHTNSYETVRVPSKPSMRGIAGIITSPELICTMLTRSRINPDRYYETKEREFSSGMFKRPHWRRGHMKHAIGAPKNAPKTIKVPPMLIREDLIPLFGIISGTETYIDDDGL